MRLLINTVLFYICVLAISSTFWGVCLLMYLGHSFHMSVLKTFATLFGLHGNALADIGPYLLLIAAVFLTLGRESQLSKE